MKKKRLPRSVRLFLRKEKSRLNREILSNEEKEEIIKKLYEKMFRKIRSK